MLVLTRLTEEALIFDGDIEIVILEATNGPGRVRLRITASDDVEILRD